MSLSIEPSTPAHVQDAKRVIRVVRREHFGDDPNPMLRAFLDSDYALQGSENRGQRWGRRSFPGISDREPAVSAAAYKNQKVAVLRRKTQARERSTVPATFRLHLLGAFRSWERERQTYRGASTLRAHA